VGRCKISKKIRTLENHTAILDLKDYLETDHQVLFAELLSGPLSFFNCLLWKCVSQFVQIFDEHEYAHHHLLEYHQYLESASLA